jgi:hypothetical protein
LRTVQVAAKDHSLLVRLAIGTYDIARLVDHRIALAIMELLSSVANVEIQLSIRTKVKAWMP